MFDFTKEQILQALNDGSKDAAVKISAEKVAEMKGNPLLTKAFESLEKAMQFDEALNERRILFENRTDIFGNQLILDENDELTGTDEYLLSNATEITVDEAPGIVSQFGGVCWPAHIDRQSNGIIATLGVFPGYLGFLCAEFHDKGKIEEYSEKYENVKDKLILVSSDAHYLWDIRDKDAYLEIEDEPYSSALVRHNLFKKLRGEDK